MRTVEIHLTPAQFTGAFLMEMRNWHNRRRYEPDKFVYDLVSGSPVVFVDFKLDREAEEFAAAFRGAVVVGGHARRPHVARAPESVDA